MRFGLYHHRWLAGPEEARLPPPQVTKMGLLPTGPEVGSRRIERAGFPDQPSLDPYGKATQGEARLSAQSTQNKGTHVRSGNRGAAARCCNLAAVAVSGVSNQPPGRG
jgi:hypothetical protein